MEITGRYQAQDHQLWLTKTVLTAAGFCSDNQWIDPVMTITHIIGYSLQKKL